MAGRARAAAHYPAKCCRGLCKGVKRQARVDAGGMLSTLIIEGGWDEVSEVTHVSEPWKKYWDDISGRKLKPEFRRRDWSFGASTDLRMYRGDRQEASQDEVGRRRQG